MRAPTLFAPVAPASLEDEAGSLLRRAVPGAGNLITRCTVGVSSSSPHSERRLLSSSSLPCKMILLAHLRVSLSSDQFAKPLANMYTSRQRAMHCTDAIRSDRTGNTGYLTTCASTNTEYFKCVAMCAPRKNERGKKISLFHKNDCMRQPGRGDLCRSTSHWESCSATRCFTSRTVLVASQSTAKVTSLSVFTKTRLQINQAFAREDSRTRQKGNHS